jgi:hypothetical protein
MNKSKLVISRLTPKLKKINEYIADDYDGPELFTA